MPAAPASHQAVEDGGGLNAVQLAEERALERHHLAMDALLYGLAPPGGWVPAVGLAVAPPSRGRPAARARTTRCLHAAGQGGGSRQ